MKNPVIPPDEEARLRALLDYHVLDTAIEEAFDDLTFLAAEICGTPVSLVSLVDEKRQWFKSHYGIDVTETPREIAFCAHAINKEDPLIVEDALQDERFMDNPLVTGGPKVRFYAGAPLTTPSGYNIGTLCVIDSRPRTLTPRQVETLKALSRRVISELERKKVFEQMTKMKMGMDDAQRMTKVGSWDWDIESNAVNWSDNQYALFGRPLASPMDFETYLNHFTAEQRLAIETVIAGALAGQGDYLIEHELVRSDGVRRIFLEAGRVEFAADGTPVRMYGTTQDVTEAREADAIIERQQSKLISTAKMSALGEMAGGIAHEINNPLTIISGKASQLKRELEQGKFDPERFKDNLQKIDSTVNRISKIIRGLLSFARNSDRDPMLETDLILIVNDTLEFCSERFRRQGIELRVKTADAIQLTCRAAQISQILMNLLSNAYDAIENAPEKWIEIEVSVRSGFARLSITDSGAGIAPEIIEKIMQPFFTTKSVGKGTGLGLSLSKGLAEEHQGSLIYDTASAHTRFVLELPLSEPTPNQRAA